MKKLLGLAAFAAFSIGTAHAAPVIAYTYNPLVPGAFTAVFSDTPTTASFSDRFSAFTITEAGFFTGTISSAGTKATNFVDILVANLVGPIVGPSGNTRTSFEVMTSSMGRNGHFQLGSLDEVLLQPGTYRIFVSGTSAGKMNVGSLSGNFNFIPAPEPVTWGLMILGFAGIGVAMRRRSPARRVQVAYS